MKTTTQRWESEYSEHKVREDVEEKKKSLQNRERDLDYGYECDSGVCFESGA